MPSLRKKPKLTLGITPGRFDMEFVTMSKCMGAALPRLLPASVKPDDQA
jgi:hypothetical protein